MSSLWRTAAEGQKHSSNTVQSILRNGREHCNYFCLRARFLLQYNYAFCKLLSHFVVQHTRHSTILWCLRLRGGDRERVTICLRISVLVRLNARHAVCHICGKINDGRICKYNSKIHVESELGYYPLNVLK